jgi:hypothetical protein
MDVLLDIWVPLDTVQVGIRALLDHIVLSCAMSLKNVVMKYRVVGIADRWARWYGALISFRSASKRRV